MIDIESETVIRKLSDAAGKYDRSCAGTSSLDAFEAVSMRPAEFKSNLKLAFNLQLTVFELSAIIKLLNKDKPEELDVNCAKFLVLFMRLGVMERTKKIQGHRIPQENTKNCSDANFKDSKMMSASDLKFTSSDRESVMFKLKEAAKEYVIQFTGAISLRPFDALHITPDEFKEQLRIVFKIQASSSEIGYLLSEYEGT